MKKIDNLMNMFNEQEEKNSQISNLLWVLEEYIKEKVEDMGSEPIMCGVEEVMKYAGCCEKQARRILRDPDLAVFDKGHKLLVERNELKRYLASKRTPASKRYWDKLYKQKGAA